jgi:hypothetical protein
MPQRPKIVCILTDDVDWGDLGWIGHINFATPTLDRIAAEDMSPGARTTVAGSACLATRWPACSIRRDGSLFPAEPDRRLAAGPEIRSRPR